MFVDTSEVNTTVRAAEAATPRLYLVTFDGREYENSEAWSEADLASGGSFETNNADYIGSVE